MPRRTKSSSSSKRKCDLPAAIQPPPCDPAQLNQVLKWVLSGSTEHDIAEAIRESYPDAEVRPLMVAALAHLVEAATFEPDAVLGWCIEVTRDLYRRMVEIGDFSGALKAVKQLHELTKQ